MICSGKTIFRTRNVHYIQFSSYMDDSLSITLCEEKPGSSEVTPFVTVTLPAYEAPSIGKAPERTVFIRNEGDYEDAVLVLVDEGVVVPNSVKKLSNSIYCAQLTQTVYDRYIDIESDTYRIS